MFGSVLINWILISILSCFLATGFARPVFASKENSIRLIDNYIRSIDDDEPSSIKAAWNALDQDREALVYMQNNMPKLAYLFRVRGLYIQLQELQAKRPELFGGSDPSVSVNRSVQSLRNDLSPQVIARIEKFSLSSDDRFQKRTNQDIVLEAQGRPLQDNRTIALSNPNQNRINNFQYINNRLEQLYSQKFQEPPRELVPRGNTFPKSIPGGNADVRIQGLSSEVILDRTSAGESVLEIVLNGRVVFSRLGLSNYKEAFRLYFEPGMNTLMFVQADRLAKSRASFIADFKQSFGAQRTIFLDLTPGASRVLQIEAVP